MKQTLFLDQDNFLADFSGSFLHRFGVSEDTLPTKKAMWDLIYSVPDFFLELPVMAGAEDFFWSVSAKKPIVLTSCPLTNTELVVGQKREWVRRHFGHNVLLIPVVHVSKGLYVNRPGDILVDDYGKNCDEWEAAGGYAVKHEPNDWASTTQQVFEGYQR